MNASDYHSPSIHALFDSQNSKENAIREFILENADFYYNDDGAAEELWKTFKEFTFYGIPEDPKENAFLTAVDTYQSSVKNFFTSLEANSFQKNQFFSESSSEERGRIFLNFLSSHENPDREIIHRYHNLLLTIFDQLLEMFRILGNLLLQQGRGVEMYVDLSGETVRHFNAPELKAKQVIHYDSPSDSEAEKAAKAQLHNDRAAEKKNFVDTARSRIDKNRDGKSQQMEQTLSGRSDLVQILASLINKFESLLQAILR